MKEWPEDLRVALDLAEAAGRLIVELGEQGFEQKEKADRSLVTTADLASDDLIREGLGRRFPEDGLLSEEAGWKSGTDSSVYWLIDPLDGTRAFAEGKEGYSVLIARVEAGEVVLGVVHLPGESLSFFALRGKGAYRREVGSSECERIPLSYPSRNPNISLSPSTSLSRQNDILKRTGLELGPVIYGAGGKMIRVAEGEADSYFSDHDLSWWDTGAPSLILEEAGGEITNLKGESLQYTMPSENWKHDGGLVASRGLVHFELVCALGGL